MNELLAGFLFAAWFTMTCVRQFAPKQFVRMVRRRQLSSLIPSWRLFAPVPTRNDFHLEYRLADERGEISEWRRVTVYGKRPWFGAVLNPRRRLQKCFRVHARTLVKLAWQGGVRRASGSLSYLQILHWLQHAPGVDAGAQIQFRIVSGQDFCEEHGGSVVFTSGRHRQPSARRADVA